ncbi:flagellar basal body-associated FliL family protein [Salipiger abyssi]|uniref:flagellar basal body-associated FliL family protein n=1 Tax=Salipiger abyssi TaxID=1250539 RepID=UPI0040582683
MKKLLPILLALIGTAAGTGAGIFLAAPQEPAEHEAASDHGESADAHDTGGDGHAAPEESHDDGHDGGNEYAKMSNQFVVPVIGQDRVDSLVVMSLSLEVTSGGTELVFDREPKLRDAFLRVLFDHANIGGFEGNFTDIQRLEVLRRALMDAARNVLGASVLDVLITEIARQDN